MRPCRQQGSCRTRSIKVWTEGRPAARACGQVVSFRYCSEALSGPWRHGGTNGAHARIVTCPARTARRSEEHTSELQSLMRISYAVFCLKQKNTPSTNVGTQTDNTTTHRTQS